MGIAAVQRTEVRRIRGPNLAVLIPRYAGVPFDKVLPEVDAQGLVKASNKRLDRALVGSEEWRTIADAFPCRSGTITAYVEPGKKLGKQIEYIDPKTKIKWVFTVPDVYRNEGNAILVAEHPDYTLEIDGNNRIVHASAVDLVSEFPGKTGCYLLDSKHGIPAGDQVHFSNPNARYLWRTAKLVGPIVRGLIFTFCNFNVDPKQYVVLNGQSDSFGVVVETF
ncbi:MAG: hypothetical protein Q7S22_05715 [Candidatus Micrarchaeota archaeon]|nr:hypothetical protein [Candidatus Micrarchaeota archaeon]